MKAVVQRVDLAEVRVDGEVIAGIGRGLLCYVSYSPADNNEGMEWIARKICDLRIFPAIDGSDKFDRSVKEVNGEILIVSNFTLHADSRKGRRPDFVDAAPPAIARGLHTQFLHVLSTKGVTVKDGEFGSHMLVSSSNNGPVTILLERDEK